MSKIFLASLYSSNIPDNKIGKNRRKILQDRYMEAVSAAAWLKNKGDSVYSPIVHWHPVARIYKLPQDYKFWEIQNSSLLLDWADTLMILDTDGWNSSAGILAEIIAAKEFKKIILIMKRSSFVRFISKYTIRSYNDSIAAGLDQ